MEEDVGCLEDWVGEEAVFEGWGGDCWVWGGGGKGGGGEGGEFGLGGRLVRGVVKGYIRQMYLPLCHTG